MEITLSLPKWGFVLALKWVVIFLLTPIYLVVTKIPWRSANFNLMVVWQVIWGIGVMTSIIVAFFLLNGWWILGGMWISFCIFYWTFKLGHRYYGEEWLN